MITDYSIRENYRILKEQHNVLSNFHLFQHYLFYLQNHVGHVGTGLVRKADPNVFELQRSGVQLKATPHATLIFFFAF